MKTQVCLINTLLAILALVSFSCSEPKETPEKFRPPKQIVGDRTIYDFLNSIIKDGSPHFKYCDDIMDREFLPYFLTKSGSLEIMKLDSIFTKRDIDFIFKQAGYSSYFKFDQKYISKNIIELDTLKSFTENLDVKHEYWNSIHDQYGTICFVKMPLFSFDKQTAILETGSSCGGLCGEGGMYIYKKVNDKWILIKVLSEWVS